MAIVATVIGILALAAAAHYYYTTYNNEQQSQEYHEPYKPADEYWKPPQQEYHYQENPINIFPDQSYGHESTVKVTTQKTNENGLLSDHKVIYKIKFSTTPDSFQETTPYSTGKPQSTSIEYGNEIEYGAGPPHGVEKKKLKLKKYYKYKVKSKTKFEPHRTDLEFVDEAETREIQTTEYSVPTKEVTKYPIGPPEVVEIKTLKSKKYYDYKINSETKFDPHKTDVEFVNINDAGTRNPTMGRDKEKPIPTESSIPSKASTILGHFLKIVIMVMVVLP